MNEIVRKVSFGTQINIIKRQQPFALIGLVFTIISVAVLIYALIFSIRNDMSKKDYDLINQKGTITTAEVVSGIIHTSVKINNVSPTTIFYKYVDNGKIVTDEFKTISVLSPDFRVAGTQIQIKYYQENSIITGLKPWLFPKIFIYNAVVFLFIGLPLLWFALKKYRQELHLYQYGKVTKAKIIKVVIKQGLPISKKGEGKIIHYEYQTSKGKTINNQFFATETYLKNRHQGDKISIFILKNREEISTVIPKLDSDKNGWNIDFE